MRNILFFCSTVIAIAFVPFMIVKKEATLASGQTVLLRLAPVDPRSLMQGDYMTLRYEMAGRIPESELDDSGSIVVTIETNSLASFARIHKKETLATNEVLLKYRKRGGIRLGAESFMFQEGKADLYSRAAYGELKVDRNGNSVLIGLRGQDLQPMGRKSP